MLTALALLPHDQAMRILELFHAVQCDRDQAAAERDDALDSRDQWERTARLAAEDAKGYRLQLEDQGRLVESLKGRLDEVAGQPVGTKGEQ